MRTVILLASFILADAIRNTTVNAYSEKTTDTLVIVLVICIFMDIVEFIIKLIKS